jgi:hypothetical protein
MITNILLHDWNDFLRVMQQNPQCPVHIGNPHAISITTHEWDDCHIYTIAATEADDETVNIHNALQEAEARADAEADSVDDRDL